MHVLQPLLGSLPDGLSRVDPELRACGLSSLGLPLGSRDARKGNRLRQVFKIGIQGIRRAKLVAESRWLNYATTRMGSCAVLRAGVHDSDHGRLCHFRANSGAFGALPDFSACK